MSLMLTACNEEQFTCDDGTCINMIGRCNRKADCKVTNASGKISRYLLCICQDISDEKNCKLISFDPLKYMKDNPPEPLGSKTKVSLLNNVSGNDIYSTRNYQKPFTF